MRRSLLLRISAQMVALRWRLWTQAVMNSAVQEATKMGLAASSAEMASWGAQVFLVPRREHSKRKENACSAAAARLLM